MEAAAGGRRHAVARQPHPKRLQRVAADDPVDRLAQQAGKTVAEQRRGLPRSEEHTSELQSPCNLVCRLLLEKKKYHVISSLVIPELVATLLRLDAISS